MTKTPSQASSRYVSIELPYFDQTYVSRKVVEDHMVHAEVISENISEFVSFISNLVSGLTGWCLQIAERRSLQYELDRYSDRELADIGIMRGDIEDIVLGTYVSRRPDSDTINFKGAE